MTTDKPKRENILEQRKREREFARKRVRLLIGIAISVLVLGAFVGYFFFLRGGKQSTSTSNITPTIDEETKKKLEKIPTLSIPVDTRTPEERTKSNNINYIVFQDNQSEYNITIRKGTYVYFSNTAVINVGLQFSDGRTLKMRDGEDQNIYFTTPGKYTFYNALDREVRFRIHGTITVVEK